MVKHLVQLSILWTTAIAGSHAANGAERPSTNFVIVLCDDLGYGDLRCYGNDELQTPNIDRFAESGLKLTSCYAAHPNCSPSRTGLMTGRTPTRVGVHNWIPMLSPMHVRSSEVTIATLLSDAGYDTAVTGKWHLNGRFNLTGQPQPDDHGFSHWFATQNNCLPNHRNPYNFVRNRIPLGPLKGFASDLVTAEAEYWLTDLRDKSKPFFLFVSYHEPHEPISTDSKWRQLYDSEDLSYRAHHGNISQMDGAFGRLMKVLDEQELIDNTFVMFTSDNGPARTKFHPNGSAGPLRDKKGFISDGGIRVPGIIRWPQHTKAGSVSDEPVIGTDLLPTICQIAGVDVPADRAIDGTSIVPLLRGEKIERKTPLYWHFYAASGPQKVAIRMGRWKLSAELDAPPVRSRGGIDSEDQTTIKTAKLGTMQLFDLESDIAETTDVKDQHPEQFQAMNSVLQDMYRDVQLESPTWPQWEFARYESERIEWPAYRGSEEIPPKKASLPAEYFDNPLIEAVE